MKYCKYLYADWCHYPCDDFQEKCMFYHHQDECPMFKEKVDREIPRSATRRKED